MEMLEQGYDVAYISKKLKTSRQNIYKEKSLKKFLDINKEAITPEASLVDHKIRSRKPHSIAAIQPKQIQVDNSANQKNMIRRPTKNEHILLYSGFLEGKGPEQIIAAHGIDAEIAESEYKRFLKLKGMDPKPLQKSIAGMSNADSKEGITLIKKLDSGELLSNDDVMSLIHSAERNYLVKLLSDPKMALPLGRGILIRPRCSECNRQLSGTVIDISSDDGKQVSQELNSLICYVCLPSTN